MKNIFRAWGLVRVMRLALGVFIIVQGVQSNEWLIIALGGIFTLLPLLNIGCCAVSTCSSNISNNTKEEEKVNYEEVH